MASGRPYAYFASPPPPPPNLQRPANNTAAQPAFPGDPYSRKKPHRFCYRRFLGENGDRLPAHSPAAKTVMIEPVATGPQCDTGLRCTTNLTFSTFASAAAAITGEPMTLT